jgi:3-hydroxyisobutyrate dehydrogenase
MLVHREDTVMKLGFIGTGLMGGPMAARLLAAGHEVSVWNRSPEKLVPLLAKGARRAASPGDAAQGEIAMTCVTDQHALEQVLFSEHGIATGKARLVIDFSSIAPASAREFASRLEKKNLHLIDAPVSGGVSGAEKGTLVIMAGGKAEHIERVRPVVMHLAARFTRMGDCGAGQATKLCNQVIVGSLIAVLAEAVRLAEATGVDATQLPEALKGGFADSLPLQIFGARMASRTFEPPLAAASIMLKDLENAAKAADVLMPMARTAADIYRRMGTQEISRVVDLIS